MSASESKLRYMDRYYKEQTVSYHIKLNKRLDADIIAILESKPNKQGYIKELIRADNGKANGG